MSIILLRKENLIRTGGISHVDTNTKNTTNTTIGAAANATTATAPATVWDGRYVRWRGRQHGSKYSLFLSFFLPLSLFFPYTLFVSPPSRTPTPTLSRPLVFISPARARTHPFSSALCQETLSGSQTHTHTYTLTHTPCLRRWHGWYDGHAGRHAGHGEHTQLARSIHAAYMP
jgi:hypothetical protein